MSSTKTDQEQLWDMIKDIRFGMLTHRHSDGTLHSHPLTTMNKKIDETGTLYFFVARDSEARPAAATGRQRQHLLCRSRQGPLCVGGRTGQRQG